MNRFGGILIPAGADITGNEHIGSHRQTDKQIGHETDQRTG